MHSEADSVILRYVQGDQDALCLLLESHIPGLAARIERRMAPLLRRRVSIHDVMQEVSMIAFEKRGEFRGRTAEEFRRWIVGIADHTIHTHVNHHAGTKKRALFREVSRTGDIEPAHPVSPAASPSQQAIGSELEQIATRALELLQPDYREVLRLHRDDSIPLRDIATSMGRSHDAVKKLHGRAMVQFTEVFNRLRGHDHD
jgi:RNA polymerase sigma-70 factor (subfamily 1)